MLNVTVKRSKWLRGRDSGDGGSYLLERARSRRMCCLGFACIAAGLKPKNIRGVQSPSGVYGQLPSALKKLISKGDPMRDDVSMNSSIGNSLMGTNDTDRHTDKKRETILKKNGLKAGIRFRFID